MTEQIYECQYESRPASNVESPLKLSPKVSRYVGHTTVEFALSRMESIGIR